MKSTCKTKVESCVNVALVHIAPGNHVLNLRDHSFNLKGGGLWGGGGGSVSKFDGKIFSVSDMDKHKYSENIYKYCCFRMKIMSRKQFSGPPRSEKKYFDSENKT